MHYYQYSLAAVQSKTPVNLVCCKVMFCHLSCIMLFTCATCVLLSVFRIHFCVSRLVQVSTFVFIVFYDNFLLFQVSTLSMLKIVDPTAAAHCSSPDTEVSLQSHAVCIGDDGEERHTCGSRIGSEQPLLVPIDFAGRSSRSRVKRAASPTPSSSHVQTSKPTRFSSSVQRFSSSPRRSRPSTETSFLRTSSVKIPLHSYSSLPRRPVSDSLALVASTLQRPSGILCSSSGSLGSAGGCNNSGNSSSSGGFILGAAAKRDSLSSRGVIILGREDQSPRSVHLSASSASSAAAFSRVTSSLTKAMETLPTFDEGSEGGSAASTAKRTPPDGREEVGEPVAADELFDRKAFGRMPTTSSRDLLRFPTNTSLGNGIGDSHLGSQ